MKRNRIFIFGERHSGTNWLHKTLIASGLGKFLLHNQVFVTPDQREFANRHFPSIWREVARNRFMDQAHADSLRQGSYGWKHAAFDPAKIASTPGFEKVLFICMIRNPLDWLQSMRKRPFHLPGFMPDMPLNTFLSAPVLLYPRDEVGDRVYAEGVVELWNLKVESYLEAANRFPNCLVLRYEDAVCDFERTTQILESHLEVNGVSWAPYENNARQAMVDDDTAFDAYRAAVQRRMQDDSFSDAEAQVIGSLRPELRKLYFLNQNGSKGPAYIWRPLKLETAVTELKPGHSVSWKSRTGQPPV